MCIIIDSKSIMESKLVNNEVYTFQKKYEDLKNYVHEGLVKYKKIRSNYKKNIVCE